MPTNRPTEADVRGLMERIKPSIVLGPDEKREFLALCEDWLRLNSAATSAHTHVEELREAWRTGAIEERDGLGGTRSNRNVDVEVALRKALGVDFDAD